MAAEPSAKRVIKRPTKVQLVEAPVAAEPSVKSVIKRPTIVRSVEAPMAAEPSVKRVIKRPVKIYEAAPDDEPTSLAPATLKMMSDAQARGEYLQDVPVFWDPPAAREFMAFATRARRYFIVDKKNFIVDFYRGDVEDYRERDSWMDVKKLPELEATAKKAYADMDKLRNDYSRVGWGDLSKLYADTMNKIRALKDWKPERMITWDLLTNYHKVDEDIAALEKMKDEHPIMARKLIQLLQLRKQALDELNKKRKNPMRAIVVQMTMSPKGLTATASWEIVRKEESGTGFRNRHILRKGTKFDLDGPDVVLVEAPIVELPVEEAVMDDEKEPEKAPAKAAAKAPAKAAAMVHEGYYYLKPYDLSGQDIPITDLVQKEDIEKKTLKNGATIEMESVEKYIMKNVNLEENIAVIVGYKNGKGVVKPTPKRVTLRFPPKGAKDKVSVLEKLTSGILSHVGIKVDISNLP